MFASWRGAMARIFSLQIATSPRTRLSIGVIPMSGPVKRTDSIRAQVADSCFETRGDIVRIGVGSNDVGATVRNPD